MKHQVIFRSNWAIPVSLLMIIALVGCQPPAPTQAPQATSMPESASTAAPASPSPEASMSMPTSQPGTDSMITPTTQSDTTLTPTEMVMAMSPQPCSDSTPMPTSPPLYQDDFKDLDSGWIQKEQFDNYSIGYHEPDWYHIEITTASQAAPVFLPKKSFSDTTIELQVFANSKRTAPTGDFRYGLAFRRSGDQYYAFAISPRTKKWYVLKRSPSEVTPLKEGTNNSIHDVDGTDSLRVDAHGSNFSFYINDQLVGQVTDTDPDYSKGEIGLYAESIDSALIHIHFDKLTIRNFEASPNGEPVLYQDDFTDPCTSWPIKTLDNYFVGYHEPQWYYVQISSPKSQIPIINPKAKSFGDDITMELQVFTDSPNTSPEGDFRYGLLFRRSGDRYYAFAVSPSTKKWYVLKRSPQGTEVLKDGVEESIKGLTVDDLLQVDTQGSNFFFHINDRLVGQITDTTYQSGDVGLYAETIDNPRIRIHFDKLTIRNFVPDFRCSVPAGTVYVRRGPGQKYAQIGLLSSGDTVKALGISPNQWIEIKLEGSDKPGWVSYRYEGGELNCKPSIDVFPIVGP